MRSYYEILGVKRNATRNEILSAYQKKIVETDTANGGDLNDRPKIKQAYYILLDPDKRLWYDREIMLYEYYEKRGEHYEINNENYSAHSTHNSNGEGKDNPVNAKPQRITPSPILIAKKILFSFNGCLTSIAILLFVAILVVISYYAPQSATEQKSPQISGATDVKPGYKNESQDTESTQYNYKDYYPYATSHNSQQSEANTTAPTHESSRTNRSYKDNNASTVPAEKAESIESPSYNIKVYNTGQLPYITYFGAGDYDSESLSELEIINHSQYDAVALLESATDNVIRHAYIKAGNTYVMKQIPASICIVRTMMGQDWNPEKDNGSGNPKGGFMKHLVFSATTYDNAFSFFPQTSNDYIEYPTYSITLHKVVNGNLNTRKITKEDFFKRSHI